MGNLVSPYSTKPVLHTYSEYNQEYDFKKREFDANNIIKQLKMKEIETYKLFGVNDYDSFINIIRGFFDINEQDKKLVMFFQQDNLMAEVMAWRNRWMEEDAKNKTWELTLTVDATQFRDGMYTAQQQFDKLLNDNFAKINGDGYSITRTSIGEKVTFDIKVPGLITTNLKEAIDKIYGTNFWYKANAKTKTIGSDSKTSLNDFFAKKEELGLLQWTGQEGTNSLYIEYSDPLSYNTEKVKSTNKVDVQQVDEGMKQLKEWIKNGGEHKVFTYNALSLEMQKAFEKVWQVNFSTHLSASFFMKGGTSSGISGSFGELQGLIITNFFLYKNTANIRVNKSYLSKVDDVFGGSEAGRSDLAFYKRIGIQVKNYSSTTVHSFTSDLKTTQYLGELSKNYFNDEANLTNMPQFLANYFFNSTFQQNSQSEFNQLTNDILPDYFAEIANFDLDDGNKDRNSFYLIEGRYLVPVSDIYQSVFNNIIEHSVSITSSFANEARSDEDFAKIYHTGSDQKGNLVTTEKWSKKQKSMIKANNGENEKLFRFYWHYPSKLVSGPNGTPTRANKDLYKKIVTKGISIRSSFKREIFSDVNKYSLY